jgi:hypothetical protein
VRTGINNRAAVKTVLMLTDQAVHLVAVAAVVVDNKVAGAVVVEAVVVEVNKVAVVEVNKVAVAVAVAMAVVVGITEGNPL